MIPTQERLGPREILYAQIMRVLDSRADGHGAVEAMSGLMSIIDPLKDRAYHEELRYLANSDDSDRLLWQTLECVIRLLHRKGRHKTGRRRLLPNRPRTRTLPALRRRVRPRLRGKCGSAGS